MPYYLVHAGDKIQKIGTDGSVADVSLPSGVVVATDRPARFGLLNKTIIVTNAPSRTLLFDGGLNAHLASLAAPTMPVSVGAGAGALTGAYACAYSFVIKDVEGHVICESPLSPLSGSTTLAAQGLAISGLQQSGSYGVTTRRIYRTASGGDTLYFAQDVDDNVTSATVSAELDAALGTESVAALGLGSAPGATDADRLKLITVWKDRVWGVSNTEPDNLRYSGSLAPYAWNPLSMIRMSPVGEDSVGVSGFLARRDELGVLKLGRLSKIVGATPSDFERIVVAEHIGCIASDSCVVIRDVGYFLGADGVYCWGPEGLGSISDAQVRPWFTTNGTFNRDAFASAFGRYNWRTHSYELHLPSAGQTTIDLWVQYDIDRKRWFGPHETLAMVPSSGGEIMDAHSLMIPAVGSVEGFLWTQDNPEILDGEFEIALDAITQPYTENSADTNKLFKEASLLNKDHGEGWVEITVTVDKDEQTPILAPLSQNRTRLRRFGNGRRLTLRFFNDGFDEDCEIHGFEVPFIPVGRR